MINKKTVLILGAGSNNTYGMPLASELTFNCIKNEATHRIMGELPFFERKADYKKAFIELQSSLKYFQATSIDAILEKNEYKEFCHVGKILIAHEIFKSESIASNRMYNPTVKDNWYLFLKNLIFQDVETTNDFRENKLTIITFNYDRTLDWYLSNAYLKRFRLEDSRRGEFFETIPIIHVYGTIGSLIKNTTQMPSFGEHHISAKQLLQASESIQIWNEDSVDLPTIEHAKSVLATAQNVFTLGYGFHKQNNNRLGLDSFNCPTKIAACYDMSPIEKHIVGNNMIGFQFSDITHHGIRYHFRNDLLGYLI